ncbi:MAG: response regulator [Anaerolineales bacterium]|jgi:DNA-binding response OmpR family regulator
MTLPVRILVVDDEPDTVGLIEITLKPAGFLIEKVFTADEAINRIRSASFDLLLLDVMMPDMDGFQVIEKLKEENVPLPPFLFLTAKGRIVDVERGQALGASGYLVKPATRGELLDAIQSSLQEK